MTDGRGPKVLIVDDEVMIALTVAQFMEEEGFEAIMAHDGQQALELARAERPDVIVTDYMMPRMNGLEVAFAVRRDPGLADVPILLTSAMPPKNLDSTFAGVFTKPYQLSDLVQTICELLHKRGGTS